MTEQTVVEAYLPLQPSTSRVIDQVDQSLDVDELGKTLTRLHFAAFQTVHGTTPQWVNLMLVEAVEWGWGARYRARLQPMAPAAAASWHRAFARGLQSWTEAGFLDPLVRQRAEGSDAGSVCGIGDYDDVVRDAAGRLGRAGRLEELRNLRAYLGERLPDRLDPDTPYYTYQRPLRG